MAKYLTILFLLLIQPFLPVADDDVTMHWVSLGKDADAYFIYRDKIGQLRKKMGITSPDSIESILEHF